jgi:amino-acid N-acetyltransferase
MDELRLARATGSDLDRVAALLADAGLPTADLRDGPGRFYLAVADGERVGAGGLEPYGSTALLRSVVVAPDRRGEGYGTAVCRRLETRAADRGVDALYLLTTDAAGFFADLGYDRVDRGAVPDAIRDTRQFTSLCPESATVMEKQL